ncbi:MAG TPA: hypothetical protein PKW80_01865 [Bacteroidales bacterium]|nr:hypothetical protein [Bacteroidales bacterium]
MKSVVLTLTILILLFSCCGTRREALITGDWVSDTPIVLETTQIKGFEISKPENGVQYGEWNSEGIMYDHLENGTHVYPSSFDYYVQDHLLNFRITFSAAGLEEGKLLKFKLLKLNQNRMELGYGNQKAVYLKSDTK